ncbi:hypothetical protein G5C66_22965 [Nocardioides sp. KC13]|uniref:Hemopexin n=1 Tax=Nocardioides turkmenicus TaxID=2711220 RepID=A0A6M1R5L1_9ACTN|nr:hemopexin repeat-containing protein [Nocardioides sp. KC13]NGN95584.1 hypothetical protein [Nocardioides sp. KC13]
MGLNSRLAGFVAPDKDKAYFFLGDQYVRYDAAADAVDAGYPRPIAEDWPGLFPEDIDAALCWPDGNVYFFQGDLYVLYDWASGKAAEGYPLPIATMWPGVFESDLDAAVRWPGDVAYFIKDAECLRYDVIADEVDGPPTQVAEIWPGVVEAGIDAVLVWPTGIAHFFHGSGAYTAYDIAAGSVVDGYPRPIEGNWTGLHIESTRAGLRFGSGHGAGS